MKFKELYQNDFCSIRENDVVVDIGANIGIFSLYAMSKGAKQIFAFSILYLFVIFMSILADKFV